MSAYGRHKIFFFQMPALKSKWIKIIGLELDLLRWHFLRGIR
jgi:hypothetical protein